MSYIKDPSTGDTLHLKRESGLYPVKFEGKVIFLNYNATLQMWGEFGEQYEEFQFEMIGDKINLN